jgi:aryl-alcohol dehydrogenase-like predicted oxidoreductase
VAAHTRGLGVIAKRTLGNAPWRFAQQPVGHYCETYWHRMQALAYDTTGLPWDEFALRFCLGLPEITCAIVGTSSEANLRHNVHLAERGPLPAATMVAVRERFTALGAGWPAEI